MTSEDGGRFTFCGPFVLAECVSLPVHCSNGISAQHVNRPVCDVCGVRVSGVWCACACACVRACVR